MIFLSHHICFAVIQGAADMGIRLSENELQNSLNYFVKLFDPTSPEDHEAVAKSVGEKLLDIEAPILVPTAVEQALPPQHVPTNGEKDAGGMLNGSGNVEKMVVDKVNARRIIHQEYAFNNLESEPLDGRVMRLERGNLGLVKVAA